jgi:cell surface protein SprA
MIGMDAAFRKDSYFLTRMIDKLPLISTKEISNIDFQGEYARLFPGVAPRVRDNAFIDDFEGARTIYDLTRQPTLWRLGSTPQGFPQGSIANPLEYAYRRGKISVYSVDNTFYGLGGGFNNEPTNITPQDLGNHYEKQVQPQAIFANRAIVSITSTQTLAQTASSKILGSTTALRCGPLRQILILTMPTSKT